MKKEYKTPSAEMVEFNYTEVVTASGPYFCWCCKPVSGGEQPITGGGGENGGENGSGGGEQGNCQPGTSYWVAPVQSNATPYWGGC